MNTKFNIKYLGHSCFLIKSVNGKKILIDPFLTGNSSAAVTADSINDIDAVAVSHGAFDHLGDAVPICKRNHAKLFCGPEVAIYAMHEGMKKEDINQMIYGTSITYKGIEFRSIEAKHISMVQCGSQRITGSAMSFIFRMEDGTGIYFSGDTSIFSDLKLFGELYSVEIGILGMDGLPGCPFEMSGKEAAMAARWLGVKVAIPMHYPANSAEPGHFKEALSEYHPKIQPVILKPGEEYLHSSN
jgi:L-ascorbate metabolism protein UlaG (beta-lactamase superfamily)